MNHVLHPSTSYAIVYAIVKQSLAESQDFSIRIPKDGETCKTVKATYMEFPKYKFFVLTGDSKLPTNGIEMTSAPMLTGGDRFDCCDTRADVDKICEYLCADITE
mgnify:CR=1 FL=1